MNRGNINYWTMIGTAILVSTIDTRVANIEQRLSNSITTETDSNATDALTDLQNQITVLTDRLEQLEVTISSLPQTDSVTDSTQISELQTTLDSITTSVSEMQTQLAAVNEAKDFLCESKE